MKISKELFKKTEWMIYNYNLFKDSIENFKLEIEELKLDTHSVRAVNYDREKVSRTYNITSSTEDEVMYKIEKIEKLEKQIAKNQINIQKVDRALKCLDEVETKIIEGKYLKGLQWWQIGESVKYSERWCREKRNRAIEKIAVRLFANELDMDLQVMKVAL
jgi:DNA-directed RNA polymerase specialized sigma subunit